MTFRWYKPPEDVFTPGIERWQTSLRAELDTLTDQGAVDAESFMTANAPWRDRTWKARRGLFAYPISDDDMVGITASYSGAINPDTHVDYSYGLERKTYPISGILSIILKRRDQTFLGEFARNWFDRLKARIE